MSNPTTDRSAMAISEIKTYDDLLGYLTKLIDSDNFEVLNASSYFYEGFNIKRFAVHVFETLRKKNLGPVSLKSLVLLATLRGDPTEAVFRDRAHPDVQRELVALASSIGIVFKRIVRGQIDRGSSSLDITLPRLRMAFPFISARLIHANKIQLPYYEDMKFPTAEMPQCMQLTSVYCICPLGLSAVRRTLLLASAAVGQAASAVFQTRKYKQEKKNPWSDDEVKERLRSAIKYAEMSDDYVTCSPEQGLSLLSDINVFSYVIIGNEQTPALHPTIIKVAKRVNDFLSLDETLHSVAFKEPESDQQSQHAAPIISTPVRQIPSAVAKEQVATAPDQLIDQGGPRARSGSVPQGIRPPTPTFHKPQSK